MRADPRVLRSKATILDACADLIGEVGFAGVSIEAIALRSGAAKTTIYRHWPTRAALLIEAFGICAETPHTSPDTGSVREDLIVVLQVLASRLNEPAWCSALCSLTDAASRDPELERLQRETLALCGNPLTTVLRRGQGRGALPDDLDIATTAALLAGPLFYRAMVAREPVTHAFVAATVDSTLAGLRR